MRRVSRLIAALALALTASLAPASSAFARGKATVEWTRVDAPEGKEGDRIARTLRGLLKEASRKADFGKSGKVALRAKITEYVVEKKGDVLRIRCTIVGRVEGGASAKSRISFGGDPNDPKALEKQVLTMVAHGVTSRLAAIARSRAEAEEKKKKAAREVED
ncbi:hypothetical protein [Polyangium jinanense]|uniref:DUF4410 domain-containing protein n=1 Tax=Polyangium jinanense TaxID=2829994 RepID=A0A9X4AQK2_9BACT|nr:hypothetical protein [Polyangium jinanense]MDC3952832.1 hypothetical protein [Polyangium jinanense]MDC3980451.1 hypothetical protein [Polyangium jinanense]